MMSEPNFPFPVLVCDIGGTNVRFGVAKSREDRLLFLPPARTTQAKSFEVACATAIGACDERPHSLILCAAGPVRGRSVKLTNCDWRIDGPTVARELALAQGLLLNDFEALALALPILTPGDVHKIGRTADMIAPEGTRVILGPGTGLGVGALVETDGRYLSIASEAGHMEFAPADAEDARIFALLEKPMGRLSAETLISGPGLLRLHRARQAFFGFTTENGPADSADITERALARADSEEALTIRHFLKLVARFAGDMALAYRANAGVFFAGGILPKLLPLLDEYIFRQAFAAKAPMEALVSEIPTQLITSEQVVLKGMRAMAERPQDYLIDYKSRLWI